MRCSCGRDNREGARFCAGCGRALPSACPACHAELPEDAAFCDACGARVAAREAPPPASAPPEPARDPRAYTPRHLAERILTQRSALEGERKHVTVLFADVAGFTQLSESRDPEEMHALMDRFFQRVLDAVHRYEGTVNQFLGDGVMALFGAPVALEEAPRRAVQAALAIQQALASLGPSGARLPLRIGVHSGPVVVGRIGDDLRMDYTAVGDTTNLAARLQQIAEPGDVLLSEATRRLVEGYFDLEDVGERTVKGKRDPVHAFRVAAERDVAGRIDALASAGLTPLVGRESELATLRDAVAAAARGQGRACFVVGDAGIGKSRLLFELRQGLADVPHVWLEGRCSSYGSSPFHFAIDGLKRFFDIDARDDEAGSLEKLQRGVRALGDDLAWTEPFLQKLLSLPLSDPSVDDLDAITRRSETIRALQTLFLRAADKAPLVLAVEDLHWIDPASEQFLELLIDAIPTAHICLLLTHRPGYRQPFGDRSYHVRLALQPLSAQQMSEMAGALLESESLPRPLRRLIGRKAEGNPFFVEEVTKSLVEQGALRVVDGRVELAGPLDEISVPDSIQDVLMARIDRLDAEPKRAIQMASVIGREFALRLLEHIAEGGDAVSSLLGELRALELIYQKANHPELAYMFKHALTHDVAYESVLLQRRRDLHRIVGFAIEQLYADRLAEHFEALAHHFTRAEEWDRALLYHESAAEKARDAYANQTAETHLREALAIAERVGDEVPDQRRSRLFEVLGHVLTCQSRFREAGESYLAAADKTQVDEERAMHFSRASFQFLWGHHYDEAEHYAGEAIALAKRCRSLAAAIQARGTLAHITMTRDGVAGLAGTSERPGVLARRAEESRDDEAIAIAGYMEGIVAEMCGDYRVAIEHCGRAVAAARRARLPQLFLNPLWIAGLAHACLGEYRQGIASLAEAVDLAARNEEKAMKARFLNSLGWCFAEIGCHELASGFNEQSIALAGELVELGLVAAAPEIHCNASINLAGDRIVAGDADGALELLDPIRAELEVPGDPWQRWRYGMHVRDALARVELLRGEPERALPLVEQELAAARTQSARKLEARALELHGRTLLRLERHDDARRSLREALEVAKSIGYPPVRWRALSLLAELARRRGDAEAAERLAQESRRLVDGVASGLPTDALRAGFGSFAQRLAEDPLAALS